MNAVIGGVECKYEKNFDALPSGANPIVFLHGWGGDLRSFRGAYSSVCDWGMPTLNFEFPKTVPTNWGIYDYSTYVAEFLSGLGIASPIIVGHSFGGRIGIILAAQKKCGKLVLVDSAGMRPKFSLVKKLKIARYRYRVKHNKPLDGMGSADYNSIGKEQRGVFVRIVNTHLEKLLAYIECPTLIVWGKRDADTPPYMAKRLHRGIKNSELVFVDGGHYSYIDSNFLFLRLLKNFITD